MHENRETSAVSSQYGGPVREGDCRTPDMHAVGGSDRAVVPMKLPNNEARRASAEVVEGRARTKENVAELHTSPTQSGESVSQGSAASAKRDFASTPSSKVRAVCGNAARTDLCGGRSAMAVPTATDLRSVAFLFASHICRYTMHLGLSSTLCIHENQATQI